MSKDKDTVNEAKALEIALVAARESSEVLRKIFRADGSALGAWIKDDGGLVTDADIASDRVIAETLRVAEVASSIISEESSEYFEDSDLTWLVDPLCGTVPFNTGLAHWGVSIALRQKNELKIGVLTLPAQQEQLTAVSGRGVARNGQLWSASPPLGKLAEVAIALEIDGGSEWKRLMSGQLDWLSGVGQVNSFASAAFPLLQICLGRLAGGVFYNISPVHLAAGCIIAKELGIMFTDNLGEPIRWDQNRAIPVVVVGWPEVHKQIMEIINKD
jgi:myo-inositol-1(or 4)-monophosphatase